MVRWGGGGVVVEEWWGGGGVLVERGCLLEGVDLEYLEAIDVQHPDRAPTRAGVVRVGPFVAPDGLVDGLDQVVEHTRVDGLGERVARLAALVGGNGRGDHVLHGL